MRALPVRPVSKEDLARLIDVARFRRPATAWIRGGRVLNVYTGKVEPANVALSGDRIAYVGEREPPADGGTEIVDAGGYTLVPGYIEPHSHPSHIYNPVTLSEFALTRGTTTLFQDDIFFFLMLEQAQLECLMEKVARLPAKNFWWARLDPQKTDPELKIPFTPERIGRMLEHPLVMQAGEITAWKELLDGDPAMVEKMHTARESGKRIEAHNPGATYETLSAMAAAGATACHESITAGEVLRRLKAGMWATLRHSSIRPDLPELLEGLREAGHSSWSRVMMTTDGSAPFYYERGHQDYLVKLALKSGLEPVEAYRMVTLNPATYYGLDGELGGIAPGRVADILFLEGLENPAPARVMANGAFCAEEGRPLVEFPQPDWEDLGVRPLPRPEWRARPDWFRVAARDGPFPVGELANAVILLRSDEELPAKNGAYDLEALGGDYLHAALLDCGGEWITTGVVKGFGRVEALASTYNISREVLALGRDVEQMARAVNRVMALGGGICLYEGGRPIFELPLPLFGAMSRERMDSLMRSTGELYGLLRERGYRHEDPIYSLLFFAATHLPALRFSRRGLLFVKTGEILSPARAPGR